MGQIMKCIKYSRVDGLEVRLGQVRLGISMECEYNIKALFSVVKMGIERREDKLITRCNGG